MKRSLVLKREALAELSSGDLAVVAGARPDHTGIAQTLRGCIDLSQLLTCVCDSLWCL